MSGLQTPGLRVQSMTSPLHRFVELLGYPMGKLKKPENLHQLHSCSLLFNRSPRTVIDISITSKKRGLELQLLRTGNGLLPRIEAVYDGRWTCGGVKNDYIIYDHKLPKSGP